MKQFFTLLGIVAMGATAYGQYDWQIVNIPDEKFRDALLDYRTAENYAIDLNGDRRISYEEARAYTGEVNVRNRGIKNLRGIEAFTQITYLDCSENELTSLDVSNNTALTTLKCNINQLKSLNVSNNTALTTLECRMNQLKSLDVSNNTALTTLECHVNQLSSLDVSNNTALQSLNCYNNQLTSLDVSKNTALKELSCSNNQLKSLDVSKNVALQRLSCSNNQLTNLDVSKNTVLYGLWCYDNQLTQLNLANGNNKNIIFMYANRNRLACIQIDSGIFSTAKWGKDSYASYSTNCNYPTLSTTEVAAEQAIQILNPVKDNLIIKTTAKVERVEIYNTAGQLVKVLFKGNTAVQDLAKGIYLIKITTDQGVITEKIIKQ